MIIDSSYFEGKINLPQTGNTPGTALVDQAITDYEPEYLQTVLGYDLWRAFSVGTESGSGEPEARWQALLEGAEFTVGGITRKWVGFEAKPGSPAAAYIYYKFLEQHSSDVSWVGNTSTQTDNSKRESPTAPMVRVWNEMVKANRMLIGYLYANRSTYPEWKGYAYWPVWSEWFRNDLDSCDWCPQCPAPEVFEFKNRYDL